jgi:ATP-dependent RNA circularization protein (DNA/RNA ligase family)
MYNVLKGIMEVMPQLEWVTIQGETYGEGVQKNNYDLKGHDFMAFNLITSDKGRWNSCEMKRLLQVGFNVPCVPILNESMTMPDTVEELRAYVNGETSTVNHKMKEGVVFRSLDGVNSFKCVSPEYLLKFHS